MNALRTSSVGLSQVGVLLTSVAVMTACGPEGTSAPSPSPSTNRPVFVDVTAASGLELEITSGASPPTQILEVKGGGVAVLDWRGDGDLDLLFPNGATLDSPDRGPGARLFDSIGPLGFSDATEAAALDFDRWAMGPAVGDLDGDGLDDAYLCAFGPDAVLRQGSDGSLSESQGALEGDDLGWSSGAALGDLDRDGDLDVYVARYLEFDPTSPPPPTEFLGLEVFGGPFGLPAVEDHLWVNAGDGTFTEQARAHGLHDVPAAQGLGATIVDLDQDGRLDVYVGNDSMPDFAWYAGEDGRFVERGATVGLATNGSGAGQATMGIALADLDDDEIADVFTTNFANDTNTLRLSSGAARWRDASSVSGLAAVSRPYCGWSAAFGDFDLNGETDLIVFNGHVYPESVAQQLGSHRAQRALLFRGTGDRFERWLDVPALESPGCFRGAVLADLDRDGDQDVIATDITGPVRVLENTTESPSIVVELADSADLGARICLVEGDRRSTAWILSGAGYHSASARQAVFRAPTGPARLEVTWPDGSTSSFEGVTAGRRTVSRDGR